MEKIKEIIIVEGKDDISAVKAAVDAEVIQINGFAIRKTGAINKIVAAYENKGIIILTDPDYAGKELRKYLNHHFPNAKNAYISREEGTLERDIGVENANPESIRNALLNARCTIEDNRTEIFNTEFLLDYGMLGNKNSKTLRNKITDYLKMDNCNAKQFLNKLNAYGISKEEFLNAYEKITKE